jgi:hypothetical protein
MTTNSLYRVLAAALLVLALAGCGSKINEENFSRIENGMTDQQVFEILGKPTETSSVEALGLSGSAAVWKDEDARISVQFVNGKVRFKQFDRVKP